MLVVKIPNPLPTRLNLAPGLKLTEKKRGQHIAHHVARTDVHPGVFVHLPAEKTATVRALLADDLRALDELRVVDQERAAFATGDVFCFVKTLSGHATEGA